MATQPNRFHYEPDLRGDDHREWKIFSVKLCRDCLYMKKDTAFEFAHTGQRKMELHYYGSFPHHNLEEEKCPYCLGSRKFQIITDGMKIVPSTKKGNGTSRYIGVSFRKLNYIKKDGRQGARKKQWMASIVIDKKDKHIGSYHSEIGAARAYNKEAKKLGRRLNLIEENEMTVDKLHGLIWGDITHEFFGVVMAEKDAERLSETIRTRIEKHDKQIISLIDEMIDRNRKEAQDANKLQDYIEAEIYNQRVLALTELKMKTKE